MFSGIDRFFGGLPTWQTSLWCVMLVVFLGAVDAITGPEVSFAVFYLVPVSFAAWYGNKSLTAAIALLATLVWLGVEHGTRGPYSQQWILFWNAAVRMMFFVIVAVLFRRLKSHVEAQQRLARTDSLTGLLNRAGFLQRSEALANSAARYELSLVIGFIDLDGFKNVNDTLGHSRGDEVLRTVGATLRKSTRESDIAARLGGDEFAVLLPNTKLDGAGAFFAKLHEQLVNDMRRHGGSKVGVSIGAIVFERGPPRLDDALRFADQLMYRAKKSGNRSVIVEASRESYAGSAAERA
jgi:diguanylate cyclase (GGDEF)-like protein